MFLLVPAHKSNPGQRAVIWLCACVNDVGEMKKKHSMISIPSPGRLKMWKWK